MLYAILAEDLPGSLDKRLAARPAHLARLKALQDEGRLVLAGPHPLIDAEDPGPAGFSGSLVVADEASAISILELASRVGGADALGGGRADGDDGDVLAPPDGARRVGQGGAQPHHRFRRAARRHLAVGQRRRGAVKKAGCENAGQDSR